MRHTSKVYRHLRFNSPSIAETNGEMPPAQRRKTRFSYKHAAGILPGEPESPLDIGNVPARGVTSSRVHLKETVEALRATIVEKRMNCVI